MSPALAGGFLTTASPGKSHIPLFFTCPNIYNIELLLKNFINEEFPVVMFKESLSFRSID